MGAVVLLLALASAPVRAAAVPPSCVWTIPAAAPKLEVRGATARFIWPLGDAWFRCARSHGGTMKVTFFTRDWNRSVLRVKTIERVSAGAEESLAVSQLCGAGLISELRVTVVGTGPMDRLLFRTPWQALQCFRCPRPPQPELGWREHDPDAPPGFLTVLGRYDDAFRKCALAAGGTLSLGIFVGQSEIEARTRKDASFILNGLEKTPAFRKAFAPTNLCRDGTWAGIGYLGTGEFRQLTLGDHQTLELSCPTGL